MQGLHLTADCHFCRCNAALLVDSKALMQICLDSVTLAGLQAVNQLIHKFPAVVGVNSGLTATVLLAESHLCIHTWPEIQAVTLDVYVCNFGGDHSAKAHKLMVALLAAFQPESVDRHELQRGILKEPKLKQAKTA
jgi:S-adenosylmethionine decarboxylase